jgi:hypothetical protein
MKKQFGGKGVPFVFPATFGLGLRTERIFGTIWTIILPKMRSVRIFGRIRGPDYEQKGFSAQF